MALDAEIGLVVADGKEQPLIFSHPVYQYFAHRYGLNGKSVHWEPDAVPDAAMWEELETLLQTHPAKWMVWEGSPLPEVVERLEGLGVKSLTFDPCGNVPGSGDYLSVMKQNVVELRKAF